MGGRVNERVREGGVGGRVVEPEKGRGCTGERVVEGACGWVKEGVYGWECIDRLVRELKGGWVVK